MTDSKNAIAHDGRSLVQAFFDKLGHENDIDGLMQIVADDVIVETPFAPAGLQTRFTGRAEIEARFGDARRPMPWFHFIDIEILATEDPERWVATCRSEGQQADGRLYANSYCWIFRVRDGRIAWWTEYYDPQPVMPFLEAIMVSPTRREGFRHPARPGR